MNQRFRQLVDEFLQQKRIAVAGYSTQDDQPANLIYRRLRDNGYEVYAINPKAGQITDVSCFPDLKSIPGPVDGVVLCTPPSASAEVVRECVELGITRVWVHRSIDSGSYSDEAAALAREHGLQWIPAGCPLMFVRPDFGHRCLRWFLGGKLKV